jgi:hypothetical protein
MNEEPIEIRVRLDSDRIYGNCRLHKKPVK